MRETTIARNYAEALLALARKAGDLQAWGRLIDDVAAAMERDERLRRFLEAPQISAEDNPVFTRALAIELLRRGILDRGDLLATFGHLKGELETVEEG